MVKKELYKITRDTKVWKKGQKVWEVYGTGALACLAIGKYKGGGRWLKAWIHLSDKDNKIPNTAFMGGKSDAKFVGTVEVNESFADMIDQIAMCGKAHKRAHCP